MSLSPSDKIKKMNQAEPVSASFSKVNNDDHNFNPKLKRYLDAKFDAIDAKFKNVKNTMLPSFENQIKEKYKSFKTPEAILQKLKYAARSSVNERQTQFVGEFYQAPRTHQTQFLERGRQVPTTYQLQFSEQIHQVPTAPQTQKNKHSKFSFVYMCCSINTN